MWVAAVLVVLAVALVWTFGPGLVWLVRDAGRMDGRHRANRRRRAKTVHRNHLTRG